MAIFVNTTRLFNVLNLMKMAIIGIMEHYKLALKLVYMGVFLKKSKTADPAQKRFAK